MPTPASILRTYLPVKKISQYFLKNSGLHGLYFDGDVLRTKVFDGGQTIHDASSNISQRGMEGGARARAREREYEGPYMYLGFLSISNVLHHLVALCFAQRVVARFIVHPKDRFGPSVLPILIGMLRGRCHSCKCKHKLRARERSI